MNRFLFDFEFEFLIVCIALELKIKNSFREWFDSLKDIRTQVKIDEDSPDYELVTLAMQKVWVRVYMN